MLTFQTHYLIMRSYYLSLSLSLSTHTHTHNADISNALLDHEIQLHQFLGCGKGDEEKKLERGKKIRYIIGPLYD